MTPLLISSHSLRAGRLTRAAAAVLLALSALAAHGVTDSKAARYYEDALGRYERKDMAGSIIQLKNALQIDKTMLPVQVLLGKALLANGEVVAAEVALGEALRLGVNRAEVVVTLAQAFMAQGKQRSMLEQPFNPAGLPPEVQLQMLLLRAAAMADTGDVRAALKTLEEARGLDARSPEAWLVEVPIRIRERKFREAGDAVGRALALAPNSAEAVYQKGAVLHVQGELQPALGAYGQALLTDARHLEARVARAGLLLDLGQPAEAARDVAEIQRLAPKEPRAMYLKALLAERAGDGKSANAALREVTGLIDPVPLEFIRYRPQLMMLGGLAHFGLGEREKAKPYLEAFQRSQGATTVSKLLARIYLAEANTDRAVEVLEAYTKAVPGDGQAIALLASAHLSQGRHAKAAALMQEAVQASDSPAMRTALGLSLIGSGKPGHATLELEKALKTEPAQTTAAAALTGLYLRDGQTAKAVAMAQSLVQREAGNAGFQNLLGMALAQNGELPGAMAAFEASSRIDPALAPPQLNLARLEMSAARYDAAATRLAAMLKSDEKSVEVLLALSNLAARRGQPVDAARWLEKASDLGQARELRPGLALVALYLRSGQTGPALEAAKKLSLTAPDDLSVLLAVARARLANGDQAGARSALVSATRVAEFNAAPQVEIALLQLAANNLPGATYSLDKALSNQPEHLPAQALKAEVMLRQGDTAKAEQIARQIVAQAPKQAVGYSLLGDVAAARGQGAAAVEAYRRAHQTAPSSDSLLRLFGALWLQDGGKTALPLAEQWLKAYPQDHAVRRSVADSQARSGNYQQARAGYEGLLKASPGDKAALNNLANVLLRLKDPAAVAVAEHALAQDPANAAVIDTLGWALFQAGNAANPVNSAQSDRALQLLRDARLRDPGNATIRYHLAVVLAHTGRKNEAVEEAQAALRGGKGFENLADAENLLKRLE